MGSGTHLVRLDGSGKLASGIYWIRLLRADGLLMAKGNIVRRRQNGQFAADFVVRTLTNPRSQMWLSRTGLRGPRRREGVTNLRRITTLHRHLLHQSVGEVFLLRVETGLEHAFEVVPQACHLPEVEREYCEKAGAPAADLGHIHRKVWSSQLAHLALSELSALEEGSRFSAKRFRTSSRSSTRTCSTRPSMTRSKQTRRRDRSRCSVQNWRRSQHGLRPARLRVQVGSTTRWTSFQCTAEVSTGGQALTPRASISFLQSSFAIRAIIRAPN